MPPLAHSIGYFSLDANAPPVRALLIFFGGRGVRHLILACNGDCGTTSEWATPPSYTTTLFSFQGAGVDTIAQSFSLLQHRESGVLLLSLVLPHLFIYALAFSTLTSYIRYLLSSTDCRGRQFFFFVCVCACGGVKRAKVSVNRCGASLSASLFHSLSIPHLLVASRYATSPLS